MRRTELVIKEYLKIHLRRHFEDDGERVFGISLCKMVWGKPEEIFNTHASAELSAEEIYDKIRGAMEEVYKNKDIEYVKLCVTQYMSENSFKEGREAFTGSIEVRIEEDFLSDEELLHNMINIIKENYELDVANGILTKEHGISKYNYTNSRVLDKVKSFYASNSGEFNLSARMIEADFKWFEIYPRFYKFLDEIEKELKIEKNLSWRKTLDKYVVEEIKKLIKGL